MAKETPKSDKQAVASSTSDQTLGKYLFSLRGMKKMTLREVEYATCLSWKTTKSRSHPPASSMRWQLCTGSRTKS